MEQSRFSPDERLWTCSMKRFKAGRGAVLPLEMFRFQIRHKE
jgi:hypothetical protein